MRASLDMCRARYYTIPHVRVVAWMVGLAVAALGVATPSHAQSVLRLGNGQNAELSADQIHCDESLCVFDGNVVLNSETQVLFADKLSISIGEKDGQRKPTGGIAEGSVLIIDGNVVTACEKVVLNDDMVTGALSLAEIRVKKLAPAQVPKAWSALGAGRDMLRMSGNIERTGEKTFHIKNVYFTPCDCGTGTPTYSITAQEAWVELGSHANFYKPHLQPLDVALPGLPFALPFLHVPISKRKTGILPPGFRFSAQENAYLEEGFFWAINPTTDATFVGGWSDLRGLRDGAELRYAPTPTTSGQLNLDHMHDELFLATRKNESVKPLLGAERLALSFNHVSDVRGRWPLRIAGNAYSDGWYLLDQTPPRAPQYVPTRLVFEHRRDDWRAGVGVGLYQDLYVSRDITSAVTGRVPQRVPELGFFLAPAKLPLGAYASFELRAASSNRLIRERGVGSTDSLGIAGPGVLPPTAISECRTGDFTCEMPRWRGRFEALPRLTRPLFFGPVQVLPELAGQLSVVADSAANAALAKGWVGGKVEITSQVGRIFAAGDGVSYRHRVRPLLRWALIPTVWGVTPLLDERDQVAAIHQGSVGFETDLFRKGAPNASAARLLSFSALQHFNLGGPVGALPAAVGELVLQTGIGLTPYVSFGAGGSHNWQERRFKELWASVDIDLRRLGVGRLVLSYQRIVGGGSARINTGLFELSPGGAVRLFAGTGNYHGGSIDLSTMRVYGVSASYKASLNFQLDPRGIDPNDQTMVLRHIGTLQYDSPCDCFGVGVTATIPSNVFQSYTDGLGRTLQIPPTIEVFFAIGDFKFGAGNQAGGTR